MPGGPNVRAVLDEGADAHHQDEEGDAIAVHRYLAAWEARGRQNGPPPRFPAPPATTPDSGDPAEPGTAQEGARRVTLTP